MAVRSTRGEEIFGALVPKGTTVFRQGDPGDALYLIQSGAVEVSRDAGGRRSVLALLERGDFFGEMAIVDDERRSATVVTLADSRLLRVTRASFRARVRRDPGMALHLLRTLCGRIEAMRSAHGEIDEAPLEIPDRVRVSLGPSQDERIELAAGEILFRQGEPGDTAFVIIEGLLEVRREADGESRVVARLGAQDVVGEMAVLTSRPRTATLAAAVPSALLALRRDVFLDRIRRDPDLALHLVQVLVLRLRAMLDRGAADRAARGLRRRRAVAAVEGRPLRTAIVSLSSCGGCAAVFLEDPEAFASGLSGLEVVFCPMLMDRRTFPRVDVALVDGAVRGRDDVERLEEARAKSGRLVALGTCAVGGGLPALANRFDLEDVVAESFGRTEDLFGHYLEGTHEAGGASTLIERLGLLRRASGIGDFVRVDGIVPGCPPPASQVARTVAEIGGLGAEPAAGRDRRPVCSDCPRTAKKDPVEAISDFPGADVDPAACLASRGVLCLGFMTRGGCGAPCPQGGLPCWGCRGTTEAAARKIEDGDTLEGLSLDGMARFSKLGSDAIRPTLRRARTGGLNALSIGHASGDRRRIR